MRSGPHALFSQGLAPLFARIKERPRDNEPRELSVASFPRPTGNDGDDRTPGTGQKFLIGTSDRDLERDGLHMEGNGRLDRMTDGQMVG